MKRHRHGVRGRGAACCAILLFACAGPSAEGKQEIAALVGPPEPLPVRVETRFHLLNLTFVNERAETFDADIYLNFKWIDPHLAFAPQLNNDRKIYTEKAAEDKLREIWWPEIEFVNTAIPQIRNRCLVIHENGTVEYSLGVSATFRTRLNLKRFPFDQQRLEIRLQSFLWESKDLLFVLDKVKCGFSAGDTFDDLTVRGVEARTRIIRLRDTGKDYSEFVAVVDAKRNYIFYLWRVFFPAIIIMLLSFTVYLMDIEDMYGRVNVSLTCLLACIATQFAISFNLPRISYLTPIDKLYMITYGCIALGVGVSAIELFFYRRHHPHCKKYNRFATWFVPLLYVILLFAVIFV